MVYEAPQISAVLPHLFDFMTPHHDSVLVAQNAPFDLTFLKHYSRVHNQAWPELPVLDTAVIARKVLTKDEVPNCKLGTLAEFFGTATTPNHRALDDARATVDVLHGLIERLGTFDVYTLEELQNFGKKVKRPKSSE
jgi:DNA polymerase III epsilon subunit-like protein